MADKDSSTLSDYDEAAKFAGGVGGYGQEVPKEARSLCEKMARWYAKILKEMKW